MELKVCFKLNREIKNYSLYEIEMSVDGDVFYFETDKSVDVIHFDSYQIINNLILFLNIINQSRKAIQQCIKNRKLEIEVNLFKRI